MITHIVLFKLAEPIDTAVFQHLFIGNDLGGGNYFFQFRDNGLS